MDNVFDKSDKEIQSLYDTAFLHHLYSNILNATAVEILVHVLAKTDVFVFSGVIRDYFVRPGYVQRDLDLVLEHGISWYSIYRQYRKKIVVKMNSYGGLKVRIGNLDVDVWTMERTWGLVHKGIRVTPHNLVNTAFFNFSAVIYSIHRQRFYVHRSFMDFVSKREIGILYRDNPNIPLCILNSMYYSNMLGMPLSAELKRWIVAHYNLFDEYDSPQLSHWGKIKYSKGDILRFLSECTL